MSLRTGPPVAKERFKSRGRPLLFDPFGPLSLPRTRIERRGQMHHGSAGVRLAVALRRRNVNLCWAGWYLFEICHEVSLVRARTVTAPAQNCCMD